MKLTAIDVRGPYPVYIYSGGAFASYERLHTMEEEEAYLLRQGMPFVLALLSQTSVKVVH